MRTRGLVDNQAELLIVRRMALVIAGVTFVALSGLSGVSHSHAGASKPDVTPAEALAGILLTLLSQFVGASQPIPPIMLCI